MGWIVERRHQHARTLLDMNVAHCAAILAVPAAPAQTSSRSRPTSIGARHHEAIFGRGDNASVAYDEDLAARIRELVGSERGVTEQRMFGGLAFLIGGNMAVSASGQGGLLLRVDPAETDALLRKSHAQPFEMRGRPMQGWLRVDAEGLRTKRQLEGWVARGIAYAKSLPSKR
jgi:TfoX/Sxy family transcriptional regulator of competence genes